MPLLSFFKYHGTGNDFIMIDGRQSFPSLSTQQIAFLCHRHFGIGADGLIILSSSSEADFKMTYYNSDGNLSSLCGNGSRSIVQFAKDLKIVQQTAVFESVAGKHQAYIMPDGAIKIQMPDTSFPEKRAEHYFIDTGSPHVVIFTEYLASIPVFERGKTIRQSPLYKDRGTNVNFVEILNKNELSVRTYERGVENETLSCGTGVTAAALVYHFLYGSNSQETIKIHTQGGVLSVELHKAAEGYKDIYLSGPATFVYKGEISL